MNFKTFLLNEDKAYLSQRVGDILTALKELDSDSKNMGTRDLVRFSERIVNNVRRVLHSNWSKEEQKFLLVLQKVAVAIMKAIEEKNDLPTIISSSCNTLQKLVKDLGLPINKLAVPDHATAEIKGGTEKPEKKTKKAEIPEPQITPVNPPVDPNLQANVPPLGGSTGQLNNL
mgnify:CR=1 FL=1